MAHPKRRQSKTRTAKRRTHDKAVAPTLPISSLSKIRQVPGKYCRKTVLTGNH